MSGVFCTLLEFFPVWKYHRYPSIISAVVSFLVYRYCFSILHLHVNHCTPPKSLHRRDSKVVIASMQPYFFLHFQHISNFIYKLTFSMGRGKEWIDRDIKTARLFSGLLEGMLLFTSCSFFFPQLSFATSHTSGFVYRSHSLSEVLVQQFCQACSPLNWGTSWIK